MKNLIKTNSRVEFHSTASPALDGKQGTVLGIATELPENNYWIVLLDEPFADRLAIVITDSCLNWQNRENKMKPNIVKIEGSLAARYVNGKFDQMVTVDYSAGCTRVKEDIEYFRVNGIDMDNENNEVAISTQ